MDAYPTILACLTKFGATLNTHFVKEGMNNFTTHFVTLKDCPNLRRHSRWTPYVKVYVGKYQIFVTRGHGRCSNAQKVTTN